MLRRLTIKGLVHLEQSTVHECNLVKQFAVSLQQLQVDLVQLHHVIQFESKLGQVLQGLQVLRKLRD